MQKIRAAAWLLLAASAAISASARTDADYRAQIEQWRAARLTGLTAPDGWLSLVDLAWLKPGDNSIGHAPDAAIQLSQGPARLGIVQLVADGTVSIRLDPAAGARLDGQALGTATLRADDDPKRAPSLVSLGSESFYVIARGDRRGLRIRDSEAPGRLNFQGLDYFPIDPAWRIEAEWRPFHPPKQIEIGTVIGTVDKEAVPGEAVFTYRGHHYALYPIQEDADSLFFIIADATSGHETYGAARFLSTPLPKHGKLLLDFNQAINPPCAFSPYATCPLPPKQNRLPIRITAGEKKYRGGSSHVRDDS